MFLDPDSDPREGGPRLGDERMTLNEFLRGQRLTLQLKCDGLSAEQLARRAVEPSTMSLLGLVRHLAEVERSWFRRRFAEHDVPKRYQTPTPTSTGRSPTLLSSMRRGWRGARRSPSLSNSRATTTSTSSAATPTVNQSPCASCSCT
jgi:uncharacterized damage-inducible protein DinB